MTTRFGFWLAQRLQLNHLTEEELAQRANVDVDQVRAWIAGREIPSIDMAERLADVLNVPDGVLLDLAGWDDAY